MGVRAAPTMTTSRPAMSDLSKGIREGPGARLPSVGAASAAARAG
jgi:hypothetical protein